MNITINPRYISDDHPGHEVCFDVQINAEDTIEILKKRIRPLTIDRIHPNKQVLRTEDDVLLHDTRTVGSYGIQEGDTLTLTLRVVSAK